MRRGITFCYMEIFILRMFSVCYFKQIAIPDLFNISKKVTIVEITLFLISKKGKFSSADFFHRFNDNESKEISHVILQIWLLFFCIWKPWSNVFFSLALCSTINHIIQHVGNLPRGKLIHLVWDVDTLPVYSS